MYKYLLFYIAISMSFAAILYTVYYLIYLKKSKVK